jgi:DNA modification methylase
MNLKPDNKNSNKGTKRGQELLEQSLQELGAGRSILTDKDGNIIAGNKTYAKAQKLGLKLRLVETSGDELVVVQRNDLDLTVPTGEARRLAYLDNRVAEIDLEWDPEQVAEDAKAGMDFEAMGFMEGELREVLDQMDYGEETSADPGDQTDKADELLRKWKTENGQVWGLGEHRLVCGDCTDQNVVDNVFESEEEMAALAFTSPPYWVGKSYETQTTETEIDLFIEQVASRLAARVKQDLSRIVINTGTGFTTAFDKKSKRQVLLLIDKWSNALRKKGWNLRHVRHWLKEGQLMSTSPRTDVIDQHNEFLGTYEHQEGKEMHFDDTFNDGDIEMLMTFYNRSGKQRGQEWTGAKWALRSYWDDIRGTARANGHEAAFPVELPLRHLMLYTKRGEVVFEPFCGSGTTLIGCEAMKRKCRAIEINPAHVAATLERWAIMTGREPVLESKNDRAEI